MQANLLFGHVNPVNKHHSIEVVVVHWTALETAKEAAEKAGLDQKMIVLISAIGTSL